MDLALLQNKKGLQENMVCRTYHVSGRVAVDSGIFKRKFHLFKWLPSDKLALNRSRQNHEGTVLALRNDGNRTQVARVRV